MKEPVAVLFASVRIGSFYFNRQLSPVSDANYFDPDNLAFNVESINGNLGELDGLNR